MEKLSLVLIKNPFNRYDREIKFIDFKCQTLLDLRKEFFPEDIEVSISVNGKLIPKEELALTYPQKGDQILFVPELTGGGGGGKNILRTVLMLAVVVASHVLAPELAPLLGIKSALGVQLVAAGLTVIGGLLVNAFLPPPKPKLNIDKTDFDKSITYSWNPLTTQQQGIPISKIYGLNKVYGNVISTYIQNIGNSQYLNVLLGIGLGPIYRLYDYKINDQPVNDLKGVEIHSRYGYLNQSPVPNFNDTLQEYTMGVKVTYGNPYTYLTVGNSFGGLEIDITFPAGIFYVDDNGNIQANSIDIKIEIQKEGESTWTPITTKIVTYQKTNVYYRWSLGYWGYIRGGFDRRGGFAGYRSSWIEVSAGSTNPYEHYDGQYKGGYYDDYWWRDCYWRWISIEEVITVSETVGYTTITDSNRSAIRKTFRVDNLQEGKYRIKVSKLTPDRNSARYGDDMYLTAVREIYYDDFQYPRLALVGIKALASDQLSGSFRFSCMCEGSLIRVWNGTSWSVQYNNNPAWVTWDILTQPVFDNNLNVIRYDGINPSRLDLVKFKEWADYCDELVPDGKGGYEKRCTFNGVFDSATSMWEAAMQVCQVGRAVLVFNGSKITVAIDKPANPVQLFSVGNIGVDSFKETFLSMQDRANEIEIDFINMERDFKRDKFTVFMPPDGSVTVKSSIQLAGIIKPSEAWRAGMYRLYCNQYLSRTIEFEADIDSIACTIGDVIFVQHDIPQWGFGGRIVSATSTTVTLDQKIYIDITKSYGITIKLADDTIVDKTIVNPAQSGEYDTFTVSSPFSSIPQQYDIYAFGELQKVSKPFRIIGLAKANDQKATITAIEYNESIYNVDYGQPAIPTYDYSSLEAIPSVKNIKLDELLIKNKDGSIIDVIDVYFDEPLYNFKYAEVWYSDGGSWRYAGVAQNGFFRIQNVLSNILYQVAVVSVNTGHAKQKIEDAPKASIYTLGKLDPPSNVQNFTAKQNGQFINFNWSHIPDADLWGYEIRIGTNWESARVIATAISSNQFTWQAELNGTYRFLIKAIDESGLYSLQATSVDITLYRINENLNIILSQDEMTKTPPADGTKTNFVYVNDYHALMMPHTLTDTDVPGWTDTTTEIINYKEDINTFAEYITNSIDTYKNTDTWIRVQEAIDAIDTGTTDLSYPDRTDLTYPHDTDQHVTMPAQYQIFYSISEDNVNWSQWKQYFGTVQEKFRYVKIKFIVNIASQTGRFKLLNLLLNFDVPDVEFEIKGFNVTANTENDIVFNDYGVVFYTEPIVRATLINDTANKVPVISNKTASGFHIDLLDTSNAKVSGVVDISVHGY